MAVLNNLYPPVIETYMPAFIVGPLGEPVQITDKEYTVYSYANIANFEDVIDETLNDSDIDSVEELYNAYQVALAAIIAQYPDPETPARVEAERVLKAEYHADLEALLAGYSAADISTVENAFDEIAIVKTTKTTSYTTVHTTDSKYICRIYFNISAYNTIEEILHAQVTVRNQYTNKSSLNTDKYPCEIALKEIHYDETRTSDDKYYIELRPEDMEDNNFDIDTYYKVQIRFTSANAFNPEIDLTDNDAIQAIDSWLAYEWANFSEWSTVCLIRGISEPTVSLTYFAPDPTINTIQEAIANIQIVGKLTFADENETETLKSYNIAVYDNQDTLLYYTNEQFSNDFVDTNTFNYDIKRYLPAGEGYYFNLTYTTNNLYTETVKYLFTVTPITEPTPSFVYEVKENEEDACISLEIAKTASENSFTGTLYIRRADAKDNFAMWEDIYQAQYTNANFIAFEWTDFTIESGIWYKYAVQTADSAGKRSPMLKFGKPVMLLLDDMFLVGKDKQLKIKFNPSVSSFKRTIAETKIETIGSQFPFFKRSGYMNYVQFPIGGLISTAIDENHMFTSKEQEYGDMLNNYNNFNDEKEIPLYRDVIWEKAFRNRVEEFLYADDVKLFRSPTEGNILIKIMDVNFQPNQTLGRRLWSFSAMAYEMDNCTIENYKKYNINLNKVSVIEGTSLGGE